MTTGKAEQGRTVDENKRKTSVYRYSEGREEGGGFSVAKKWITKEKKGRACERETEMGKGMKRCCCGQKEKVNHKGMIVMMNNACFHEPNFYMEDILTEREKEESDEEGET